jgi:hypothetical protein
MATRVDCTHSKELQVIEKEKIGEEGEDFEKTYD